MTHQQQLNVLRARGYGAGPVDVHTGSVRIWIPGGNDAVDVHLGRELEELAAGRLTLDDLRERREDEVVSEER